jgi:hypothetical protein
MADALRVMVEVGPKGKRVVATAADWPGLERGAKTEALAIERLLAYAPRYAPVATLAGLAGAFPIEPAVEVVERYPGVGSTDFWGISFAFAELDRAPLTTAELDRALGLMRAAWDFFDQTRARVSPELRKGPRGGGRDRDQIARHVLATERDWTKKLALPPSEGLPEPAEALAAHRDAYCAAIRALHAEGKPARSWPLPYLIRHTAFHTLDHAWEMEDRNLAAA